MIKSRIQIENGAIEDSYEKWGFVYLDGDRRFAAPEKKRDKSTYAEQAGENEDARTVDDVFDYSVRMLIEAPNKDSVNANSKIKAWNDAVRERIPGSDIKRCKTITFYDDYKRCKIVGTPEVMAEVGENDYFRRQDNSVMDCVVVTLTIHVCNPNLCEFDLKSSDEGITLTLQALGTQLKTSLSRPLAEGETLNLLSCGRGRSRLRNAPPGAKGHEASRNRWHIKRDYRNDDFRAGFHMGEDNLIRFTYEYRPIPTTDMTNIIEPFYSANYDTPYPQNFYVKKTSEKKYWFPNDTNIRKLCFAFAIYKGRKRVSNVAYFRVNFRLATLATEDKPIPELIKWITLT